MLPLSTMAVLCAAFFFSGAVDAVCGGGGLISIPVLMMTGVPAHSIMGINQCVSTPGIFLSYAKYRKSGFISRRPAICAAVVSLAGSALGARINLLIPEFILKIILIALVPLIGGIVLFCRNLGAENRMEELSVRTITVWSLVIGFFIGLYQGFYGAGSGTLFLLAFSLILKMDLVTASGTTKFVLIAAVTMGAVTYALSGVVIWPIVLPAVLFNVAGSYVGTIIAVRKGARIIRPMFAVILVLLVIRIISDLAAGA